MRILLIHFKLTFNNKVHLPYTQIRPHTQLHKPSKTGRIKIPAHQIHPIGRQLHIWFEAKITAWGGFEHKTEIDMNDKPLVVNHNVTIVTIFDL